LATKIKYRNFTPTNVKDETSLSFFNDNFGDIFNGGSIKISKNTSPTSLQINTQKLITTKKNVSVSNYKINSFESLETFDVNEKLKLNYDKSNLENYSSYGSLREKVRYSLNEILTKFPGGLSVNSYIDSTKYFNITDYSYNENKNVSSFKIFIGYITNPFNLNFNSTITSDTLNNLVSSYNKYQVFLSGRTYNLVNFTGVTASNPSFLNFDVEGELFEGITSSTLSVDFLIRPSDSEFNLFYKGLSDLAAYLLNKNTSPIYTAEFKVSELDDDGNLIVDSKFLTFPVLADGYNLDVITNRYNLYIDELFDACDNYDTIKSDLILRKLIPKSILDFDRTSNNKIEKVLRIYGNEIDEVNKFIDSVSYINRLSYDKIDNVPDLLVKNLGNTLGWETFSIVDENDLFESVFGDSIQSEKSISTVISDVDIELWRRILINSFWFLKSKGTRKAIETIFKFIGAPDCLINFNEYIYTVEGKIDLNSINISELKLKYKDLPFDSEGYPKAPSENTDLYFQSKGNTDGGQTYIDIYRKLGFNVNKTIDNKKSWVYTLSTQTRTDISKNTNYTVNSSKLVLNTKEISLSFDIAKAIECDVYNFNKVYDFPVSYSGRALPYPNVKLDITGLTFAQYVDSVYKNFIDVKNRKVIKSEIGIQYPTLGKLYYDYLNAIDIIGIDSNKRTFRQILDYIDKIDIVWSKFIDQLIPATTIIGETGGLIRNTVFGRQKFAYKHGIDDGSEFTKKQLDELRSNNALCVVSSETYKTIESEVSMVSMSSSLTANTDNTVFSLIYNNVNIKPKYSSNSFVFETPKFNVSGATKIDLSSLTNGSKYIFNTNTAHTLSFIFTSNTEFLSSTTNTFNYELFKYDNTITGFNKNVLYSGLNLNLSGYVDNKITDLISNNILESDSEYIIKPYFNFYSPLPSSNTFNINTAYTYYDDFKLNRYISYSSSTFYKNNNTYTGLNLTTKSNLNNLNTDFGIYEKNKDYYFLSFSNPEKPLLNFPLAQSGNTNLIVESFIIPNSGFTGFTLTNQPLGDIMVAVNGVTLLKDIEWSKDNTVQIPSLRDKSYYLYNSLTNLYGDVLTVTYLTANRSIGTSFINETIVYSTGSTKIIYNTATTRYDIHLDNTIDVNNDIVLSLNGVILANGSDYTISVYNNAISVLNFTLVDGDVINIYYTKTNDYLENSLIEVNSNPYTINWFTNQQIKPNINGYFEHQFYDNQYYTGTTIYSARTNYNYNTNSFNETFDWTNTTLIPGNTYYYQLLSHKEYITINEIIVTGETYSNKYRLKIPL